MKSSEYWRDLSDEKFEEAVYNSAWLLPHEVAFERNEFERELARRYLASRKTLTFNEYQAGTRTTAAYAAKEKEPERLERFREIDVEMIMTGLRKLTEASLLFDKVKKHIRDGNVIPKNETPWSRLNSTDGKEPGYFIEAELARANEEIRRRAEDFTTQRLYVFFGLFSEVGEVAELFAEFITGGLCENLFLEKLRKEMGDVLWYQSELAFELYSEESLQTIAAENLAKLASRKKRGKIHGSGDER